MERKPAPLKAAATAPTPAVGAPPADAPPAEAGLTAAPSEPIPQEAAVTETTADTSEAPADVSLAPETVAAPVDPGKPAEPTEPVMIEVWRPGGRRDNAPPRNRRPPRQARSVNAEPAAETATAAVAPHEGNGAESQPPPKHDVPRRSGPRREREDGQGKGRPRREGGERPRRDEQARPRHDGRDRPRREPRAGEGMRFSTEPPKGDPRTRQADPNSPFAALAALKAELEAKERGG
jgi:ATP-dependent RNA helicase SUPV3L1/SUV3